MSRSSRTRNQASHVHVAVFVPPTPRNVQAADQAIVAELQALAVAETVARAALDVVVRQARAAGLSWFSIGWAIGLTGEAVKRRSVRLWAVE